MPYENFQVLTITSDPPAIVVFNSGSYRQYRDVILLTAMLDESGAEYIINPVSEADALTLISTRYAQDPRLPVGRPAVVIGNEIIYSWHRICCQADNEIHAKQARQPAVTALQQAT